MKTVWKLRTQFMLYVTCGVGIMALIVAAVMWLWNGIIPDLTGWEHIGYWQALGLTVLCRLLTGTLLPSHFSPMRKQGKWKHLHNVPISEQKEFIRRQLARLGSEDDEHGKE